MGRWPCWRGPPSGMLPGCFRDASGMLLGCFRDASRKFGHPVSAVQAPRVGPAPATECGFQAAPIHNHFLSFRAPFRIPSGICFLCNTPSGKKSGNVEIQKEKSTCFSKPSCLASGILSGLLFFQQPSFRESMFEKIHKMQSVLYQLSLQAVKGRR